MKYLTAERLIEFLKQVEPNTLIVLNGRDHTFSYASAMIAFAEKDEDHCHYLYESAEDEAALKVVVIE